MKKLLLVHRHEYGTSTAFFNAQNFEREDVSEEQATRLAKLCGLDFEPDKNEKLDILEVIDDCPTITLDMLR